MIQQSGSLSIVLVDCAELGDLIVCYAHRWLVKPFNKHFVLANLTEDEK